VPTDTALAAELIDLADAEERAVLAHTRRALDDAGFGRVVRERLGWHPADDPAELWRRAGRAPTLPWLVTWDPAVHPEAADLAARVARGTARLREVVAAHGWPGRGLVGEDGSDAAWMLAMHADADVALQRRCAELLAGAVAAGDADPRHRAQLVDRIASATDGVQHYGTLVFGGHALLPVVDEAHLDDRRAALGLPPLAVDQAEPPGQLPYRHLRRSPAYRWPVR
jgi:hypothetical protein